MASGRFLLVSTTIQRMSQTSPTEIEFWPLSGHPDCLGNPASLLVFSFVVFYCIFIVFYCILLFILVSLGETRLSPHTLQFPRTWKFSGSSNPNTRTFCLFFRSQDQLSRRRFPTGAGRPRHVAVAENKQHCVIFNSRNR